MEHDIERLRHIATNIGLGCVGLSVAQGFFLGGNWILASGIGAVGIVLLYLSILKRRKK